MQKLLEHQKQPGARIANAYTNLLKKGRENIKLGIIQSRLETSNDNMSNFRDNDDKIYSLDITAFKDDSYFTKDFLEQIEEAYCDVKEEIIQEWNDFTPEDSNNISIQ